MKRLLGYVVKLPDGTRSPETPKPVGILTALTRSHEPAEFTHETAYARALARYELAEMADARIAVGGGTAVVS